MTNAYIPSFGERIMEHVLRRHPQMLSRFTKNENGLWVYSPENDDEDLDLLCMRREGITSLYRDGEFRGYCLVPRYAAYLEQELERKAAQAEVVAWRYRSIGEVGEKGQWQATTDKALVDTLRTHLAHQYEVQDLTIKEQ